MAPMIDRAAAHPRPRQLNLLPSYSSKSHIAYRAIMEHGGIINGDVRTEAIAFDVEDPLREMRESFIFPQHKGNDCIYLCGNSLGLQPRAVQQQLQKQLDKWGEQAVEGHFTEPTPWLTIDDTIQASMARIVGASPQEVTLMNSLTCNLHLMMVSFYRPTTTRYKILIEKKAFPSDIHAVISQLRFHGYNPSDALLEIEPAAGETSLRIEAIEEFIHQHGASIALVLFSGVQYFTGQAFDMARISQAAATSGCRVGFDLAHAVGNIELKLHDWGCDFACWCTYKYLNCGPGSIGGCFVHEKNSLHDNADLLHFAGWWGHQLTDRFDMKPDFIPSEGVYGYRLSNPPVLLIACARASLDLFDQAGMDRLRHKSVLLTGYLERLLVQQLVGEVVIFTPSDPIQRGCQLSLKFQTQDVDVINKKLKEHGIICDVRRPDVMRVAPCPLYNSFLDVFNFVATLKMILTNL